MPGYLPSNVVSDKWHIQQQSEPAAGEQEKNIVEQVHQVLWQHQLESGKKM